MANLRNFCRTVTFLMAHFHSDLAGVATNIENQSSDHHKKAILLSTGVHWNGELSLYFLAGYCLFRDETHVAILKHNVGSICILCTEY